MDKNAKCAEALEQCIILFGRLNDVKVDELIMALAQATTCIILTYTVDGKAERGLQEYIKLLRAYLPALREADQGPDLHSQPVQGNA